MLFQWDAGNIAHIARHNITPAEAEEVMRSNPLLIQPQLRNGEQRFLYLGETAVGVVLFVTTVNRSGLIRVVTAYKANRKMRAFYHMQKGGQP